MAPGPLTSAAVGAAVASGGLHAVGVRGLTVLLLYSCGFMSTSQRTEERMSGICNSLPGGPCECISLTHAGRVKKGTSVSCSISGASMKRSDIKECVIIMLSGGEKKRTHPSGGNVLLSKVALMAGILCLLTLG